MMGRCQRNMRVLLHPFYIVNVLLSTVFFISKTVPPLCTTIYDSCQIDFHEYELLIFLGSFIALRNKRQFSIPDYLSHFCLFAKILSLIMFWKQNVVYAIIFGLVWLLQACFLQQPYYQGPDQVLYLRDFTFEQEVLHGDTRTMWLIAFYAAWSPACIKLQPIFAELSADFGLSFLKFAKLDITRYPDLAKKYDIDVSSMSKQIPTLILFRHGRELVRRPGVLCGSKKSVQKFFFTYENIVGAFSLNEFYMECKKLSASSSRSGVEEMLGVKKDQ
ncbi:Thioredoxin- transmembrane protein 2 [Clonorchis sinensis]|uniref:Thioredoxin- transmembrane protein 2 n=1 Tax=Clonorchis sinensis TaxID=79923 RepID=A0A8T1MQF4_CLOSI|nr:Thioredoxin- transmembrane protein 2 [Clonorchis sinensis]